MTFPVMPAVAPLITAGPTISYIGATQTTGDGFPSGNLTFTSGTKIIAIALDQAGALATSVTIGGVNATLAVSLDVALKTGAIWYLETSASGSLAISGSGGGGGGRSVLYAYEIRNYASSTPFTTSTASKTDATPVDIVVSTMTNALTFGCGMSSAGTVTIIADKGTTPTTRNISLESASAHFSFYQDYAEQGPTTYNVTYPASPTNDCAVVAAVWK